MICPKCGKELRQSERALGCTGYREGCDFTIWNTVAGHRLTDAEKEALVMKGKTELINDFVSKKGTNFSAFLILDENQKVSFEFPPREGEAIDGALHCPVCGKPVRKTERLWGCSDRNCSFVIFNEMAGHVLTDEEKTALMNGATIGPFDDFVSNRTGNAFSASIKLTNGKTEFVFPDRD